MSAAMTPSISGDRGLTDAVEARLWQALQDVEDPEIPVSVVGMGLIVSIAYRPDRRARSTWS